MDNYQAGLLAIQYTWAQIKYRMPKTERRHAFETLLHKTESFHQMCLDRADAISWSAVVLYNYTGKVLASKNCYDQTIT